jgi:nucleoside-diphosphate-sugar epimerase
MKAIITGGSGFLGSHIAHELEQNGHEVVVFDLQISRFHDLRFPEIVEGMFEENADADLCIHLAAKVGRLFGEDNPMETITDNVGMTALVAQACGAHRIRMAYASTSEIYGDNGTAVCDELEGPFSLPHNVYGISKFFGEDICRHYAPEDLTIFRFSMPYGPGLPAGRGRAAIINMLHQALHRKKIPVHTGAERSWCYVTDTVRAVRLAIDAEPGVWNIGRDDAAVSMLTVARIACELTGCPITYIEEVPPPRMQTVVKRLSTERIRVLGWEPEVELTEGMRRTLAWVETLDEEGNPKEVDDAQSLAI